jgi:triphosphoribosyl-dephospho-CoA synthase
MPGKIIRAHQGTLYKIRAIGIQYENTLLRATQQVNTQRGILFPARFWRQRQDGFPGAGKPSPSRLKPVRR